MYEINCGTEKGVLVSCLQIAWNQLWDREGNGGQLSAGCMKSAMCREGNAEVSCGKRRGVPGRCLYDAWNHLWDKEGSAGQLPAGCVKSTVGREGSHSHLSVGCMKSAVGGEGSAGQMSAGWDKWDDWWGCKDGRLRVLIYTGFLIPNSEHVILNCLAIEHNQIKGVEALFVRGSGKKNNR